MMGISDKIRSANYVVLATALHGTALVALALGAQYFPEIMGNHMEPQAEHIEFTVVDNQPVTLAAEPVATAVAEKPKVASPSVVEVPAPKPESQQLTNSDELPNKDEEPLAAAASAEEDYYKDIESENAVKAEALNERSDILIEQQKKAEEERRALEEKLAAMEAARQAERAEVEKLRQEQALLAEQKAEAEKEKAQAEAARLAAEQEALEKDRLAKEAEQKAIAAQEEAAKKAAQAAAAEKAATAQQKAGAGNGERIVVNQDFRQLRQMPGNKPPQYPERMRLQKVEGRGQLVYYVNPNGQVTNMRMTKSTGSPDLDHAAIEAFKKFRFVPGQPGETVHNFEFRLDGPASQAGGRLRAGN